MVEAIPVTLTLPVVEELSIVTATVFKATSETNPLSITDPIKVTVDPLFLLKLMLLLIIAPASTFDEVDLQAVTTTSIVVTALFAMVQLYAVVWVALVV